MGLLLRRFDVPGETIAWGVPMPRIRADTIDEHKAISRRALLGAAHRIIEEAGTADVPLGEIALLAGVGRTTFYEYFTDRDDVIAALVEDRLPQVIEDILASVPEDHPTAQRLAEVVTRTVEFVDTDRVLGVILHRELGRLGPEAQQRIAVAHRDLSSDGPVVCPRRHRGGVPGDASPACRPAHPGHHHVGGTLSDRARRARNRAGAPVAARIPPRRPRLPGVIDR
jgi:AcrR family transcriptional regulator